MAEETQQQEPPKHLFIPLEEIPQKQEVGQRLTVVLQAYVQDCCDTPIAEDIRFVQELECKEQPYKRKYKITEEYRPVDLGWLTTTPLLYLLVENLSEEGEVHISLDGVGYWPIPPGRVFLACPSNESPIVMRATASDVTIRLNAIPK